MDEEREQQAPERPDTPAEPVQPVETPEELGFNTSERNSMEEAFERFTSGGEQTPAPVVEETPEETPQVVATDQAIPVDPSTGFKYKSHAEAEEGAKEAARKMHEATERAKRLESENENIRQAALEIIKKAQAGEIAPAVQPVQQAATPGAQMPSREELEKMHDEDPVGFILNAMSVIRQGVNTETNQRIESDRKAAQRAAFNRGADAYFTEKHSALEPVKELVLAEVKNVYNDTDFMPGVFSKKGTPLDHFKIVMDEAADRVKKNRLAPLGVTFGKSSSNDPAPTGAVREKLTATIVPGSTVTPIVRAAIPDKAETNEEYVANRQRRQDQVFAGR